MCGISGFVTVGQPHDVEELRDAHALLRHRGPDDEGYVCRTADGMIPLRGDGSAEEFGQLTHVSEVSRTDLFLGHYRLSIIDPTPGGHQPMSDETGRYHLVYNGEIFNYIELRATLEQSGHVFQTDSDTEVVLRALIAWRGGAFTRFNGMWALAFWDDATRTLLLSRDRFGIKPLFYSVTQDTIYFASEVKALRRVLGRGTLNASAATRYLERCLLNDQADTFWSDIQELRPAHSLCWQSGSVTAQAYWSLVVRTDFSDEQDAADAFGALFEDSLRLRMRSDVSVGALLSGGLDSSLIVSTLHKLGLMREGLFEVFSAVFSEEEFSERRHVETLVDELGLMAHYVTPSPDMLESDLDNLLHYHDQPFRSLAVYSQYLLYRTVAQESDVKVLLNGQGADELFAGYTRHYAVLLGELLARGRFKGYWREARLFSNSRGVPLRVLLRQSLGHARRALSTEEYLNAQLESEVTGSALREYLAYEDRNSMSASVESRVPFLDYRIVELAFSMPSSLKIRDFTSKRVERAYARGIVPASIVNRSDKMGFVSPQELWQRESVKPLIESGRRDLAVWVESGFLAGRRELVERMDGYLSDPTSADWAFAWRASCLAAWLRFNGLS